MITKENQITLKAAVEDLIAEVKATIEPSPAQIKIIINKDYITVTTEDEDCLYRTGTTWRNFINKNKNKGEPRRL